MLHITYALVIFLLFVACDDGDSSAVQAEEDAGPTADAQAVADATLDGAPEPAAACDDSRPPLVMVHGLLASGDTWGPHAQRFASNGHCADRYHAFDWNTLDRQADHAGALDAFIDAARARHGAEQVDLMGHSAGGGLGYQYLADPARAAKVRRYVHVGSGVTDGPAGPAEAPVPTLNLWSAGDLVVQGGDIPGAENVRLERPDHYAVATSAASFEAIYQFLYAAEPSATEVVVADPLVVGGRVVVLGENTPEEGATVEVWPVGAADGVRQGDAPVATFTVGADGAWGPFTAEPGQRYELLVRSVREGVRPVRYYREPFLRAHPFVYLRTLPVPPGLAGNLLRQIPFDDAHVVLVVFSASRAVIVGESSLTVDGEEMATEALAAPADTTIALFVYDVGGDGEPGGTVGVFDAFPFLAGIDRPLASTGASLEVRFDGRTLHTPRWPSGAEGAVIVTFD